MPFRCKLTFPREEKCLFDLPLRSVLQKKETEGPEIGNNLNMVEKSLLLYLNELGKLMQIFGCSTLPYQVRMQSSLQILPLGSFLSQ
jgi:hypothetical protein